MKDFIQTNPFSGRLEVMEIEETAKPFAPHFHDYLVIGKIDRGERRVRIFDREIIAKSGDLLIFWPGVVHSCEHRGDEPLVWRSIEFHPDTGGMIPGSIETEERRLDFKAGRPDSLLNSSGVLPVLIRSSAISAQFDRIFEQAARNPENPESLRDFNRLVEEIACDNQAIRLSLKEKKDGFKNCALQNPDEEIRKILGYMEEHLSEKLTLEKICGRFSISSSTLLRLFERTFCQTPISCLESLRIRQAGLLLRSGVRPVRVALFCGYYDQSHLSRSFQRIIGLPPGEYARIKRQNRKSGCQQEDVRPLQIQEEEGKHECES